MFCYTLHGFTNIRNGPVFGGRVTESHPFLKDRPFTSNSIINIVDENGKVINQVTLGELPNKAFINPYPHEINGAQGEAFVGTLEVRGGSIVDSINWENF